MNCGLIGKSLGHSFSPMIHEIVNRYNYTLINLKEEELASFVKERIVEKREFRGLNVTIPYKQSIIKFCDELSSEARKIGAVNTIACDKNGRIKGYNTDLYGFLYAAKKSGIEFEGKKALILGTGGTSLTVAYALKSLKVEEITRVSRSGPVNYENADRKADIIINTTPVGMYPNNGVSPINLKEFSRCRGVIDVIYNPLETSLIMQAKALGIPSCNGLAMLVAQAVRSSEIFLKEEFDDQEIEKIYREVRGKRSNIVLIGMPGCGKTTIGRCIQEKMGKKLLDIDHIIEEKEGKDIPHIFETSGEKGFRELEKHVIKEAGKETAAIISTGGGAMLCHENYLNLKQNGIIYYIKRDLKKLPIKGERPLSESKTALEKIYKERASIYEKYADKIICNEGEVSSVAGKVIEHYSNNI